MGYMCEDLTYTTAIQTPPSDTMDQYNKVGVITCGEILEISSVSRSKDLH